MKVKFPKVNVALFVVGQLLLMSSAVLAQADLSCGKITSGQLTIPAYKFLIRNEDGSTTGSKVVAKGSLVLTQWVWKGTGAIWIDILGSDPYWTTKEHEKIIKIKYDKASGLYVSDERRKVKIPNRHFNWGLLSSYNKPCRDVLKELRFVFQGSGSRTTSFVFSFPNNNPSFDQIKLPDSSKPIELTLTSKK